MELKGFWLIHRCFTAVSHLWSSMYLARTPHKKADGSLKNKNLLMFPALKSMIAEYFRNIGILKIPIS